MTELIDTNIKSQVRKADGTYVELRLKEGDFTNVEEILAVPGCICNLMPAAMWNEQTLCMNFPVEFTLDKPHPQAFYSCSAEEWKTSATIKEEWKKAQEALEEKYQKVKAEEKILEELGVNKDDIRND